MNTYTRRKKKFMKLMSSVSIMPITIQEREQMAKKGVCPSGFNVHHVLPRSQGGKDCIENFALIRVEDHEKLTKALDHILLAQPRLTEEDIPYLKTWTREYDGYMLPELKPMLFPNGKMEYNI